MKYAFEQYLGRTVPIPAAIKPVAEAITNHSFFTGQQLEGTFQQELLPSQRVRASTSELAKAIANFTSETFGEGATVSPIKIDNFLQGYFGSVAGMLTMATDQLINPDRLDRPLNKYWMLSNFLHDPVGTRRINEFYELREKVVPKLNTLNELAKTDIDKRENTGRSLMPEGLDALGAEALRDILTFMTGEASKQFRIVPLAEAATADSRDGVFAGPAPNQGRVKLAKFGDFKIEGVPFFIASPEKAAAGNFIVLKGGPAPDNHSQSFPARVELPLNVAAKKIHLLSGISGWGWPAVRDEAPALTATVVYASGERESFTFVNGLHFSDYVRPIEVPGSKHVEGITD
jgi:hypothetical protein